MTRRAKIWIERGEPLDKRLVKVLGILLIPLAAVANGCRPSADGEPGILATVGQAQISSKDVSYRMAVEKAYGNENTTEPVALVSLVNEALEHEVGRIFGVAATPEDIAELSRHADETTKAPKILAEAKRTFGDDQATYKRIYLAPKIINRKLLAWYSRNADIHQPERVLIEKAYYLVQSGKSLEQAAQACGLDFSAIDCRKGERAMPALLKQYFLQDSASSSDLMMSILESMSQGEIYNNIVENDHSYKVIKLVEKNGSQYKIETITARKKSFEKWFREQAEQIEIKILDAELKKKVASKYPHVW